MGSLFSKRKRREKKEREAALAAQSNAGGSSGGGGDRSDVPSVVTKVALLGPKGAGKRTICESYSGKEEGYFDVKDFFDGHLASFTVQVGSEVPPQAATIRGNMGLLVIFDTHSEESLNAAGEIAQAVHTRGMRNHTLFLVANRRADAVGAPVPEGAVNKIVSECKAILLEVDGSSQSQVRSMFDRVFRKVVDAIVNAPPIHSVSL